MEGDSQIVIMAATRVLQGTTSSKVSNSWRLSHKLKVLELLLQNHKAITFGHMHRKANYVVDLLANKGVESNCVLHHSTLTQVEEASLR